MSAFGVKQTPVDRISSLPSVENDLGCVKTQKFAKRRELFFSDQAKANPHTNCRDSNCGSEKRSFYRRRALLRFHAAKTPSSILPANLISSDLGWLDLSHIQIRSIGRGSTKSRTGYRALSNFSWKYS